MKDISKNLFGYLEKKFDLKTRLIYKALSVNQTYGDVDSLEEYEDMFIYDKDDQFLLCLNESNCSNIQNSQKSLDKIPRLREVANHPVHILDNDRNRNPSALIPFCQIGDKIFGEKIDEFLLPVCTRFRPKVLAGSLCYSLDLREIGDDIVLGNGKDYALTLLIDLNQERSLGASKISFSYSENDTTFAKKVIQGDSSRLHLAGEDFLVHIDAFYPYTSTGGGPYEMSYVKQIETSADFRTIGQDKTMCQFDETMVECVNRVLVTGAVDKCGCIPWHLHPHISTLHNQSYPACTPITADCFLTFMTKMEDAVKDSCLHSCGGVYVDVLNINRANTKVAMIDKKGPEDRQYLQILEEYRKYKRNWRNISDYDSMFRNITQVSKIV